MTRKICFVSLMAYGALTGKNVGYIGGAEVDQALLAKELVKHGFDVSFVTFSEGKWDQNGTESIDGVKLIKMYYRDNTSKLSLLTKARFLWRAMREADADIYFEEGILSLVALFCSLKRKKFLYCVASDDYSFKHGLKELVGKKLLDEIGIRLNANLATKIVAQNEFQAKMLKQHFGRESEVIPPAYYLDEEIPKKEHPPIVLWGARLSMVKQPELFLELAKAMPEVRFQMIGGRADHNAGVYDKTKESASKIPNLEFLGFIPFPEIDQFLKRASILVNTSSFEGFPTIFVQSWAAYTPVVTLNADPNEAICQYRLGFHSKSFEQMVENVKQLLSDDNLRHEMAQNARTYVEKNHDIKLIAAKYLTVLEK